MYMCMFTEDYERELMLSTHVVFQTTQIDENSSRTHRTRTVSRSCEYACGFSKY